MGSAVADRDEFRRRIDDAIRLLFGLVIEALARSTAALLEQDVERAKQVIADDRAIDERCGSLMGLVKERLSEGGLDPEDLENLVAILQIAPELERSADLAEHIAQRTLRGLGGVITPRSRGLIQSMSDIAVRMWQAADTAYAQRSRDASFELSEADDELDDLAASLVSEGIAQGADPQVAVDLALIARFYERLGDHAVNLARRVDAMAAPRRLTPARIWSRRRSAGRRDPGDQSKSGLARVVSGLKHLRLIPTDEGFLELFQAAATNARDCAEELSKLIAAFSDLDEHYQAIKAFEHQGDQITIELLRRLDSSFVTPYDREDIHALAEELDDVVDDMFSAASLMQLVHVEQPLPELAELAEVLVAMADEMVALMGCLGSGQGARYRLERIEHLERQGDAIFRHSMARLFSGEYEALEVIKWKDIIQALEDSLNAIEDVSDVVESILVKNS
ncbi:MAG: phosphate transport system protein [Acidimicrobiaceae bacterium]|jgi:predicted phosphate transport protein (TIGR00153 family)|nr:phosphate transport system protein [Acidimicrobiaceae bacterium]MDQ1366957.1 phosphate transport system protein [Acidimicrobiaceae bacterium]MDQ1398735.1 phosphate transport system protein [Acidimicrobiaceae bacterium]MDQ1415845.1 phosphate transport system protein [Acidimicrobiaceae bacterium]MDQ1420197.1 phosphate transport system protein [Acidimicrobiaceae bacterium]